MSERPSYLPSRETLESYLCALIPPSITCLEEQLHFLELDFKRAILEAKIEATMKWGTHTRTTSKQVHAIACSLCQHLAIDRAALAALDNPLPPHALAEAERAADAATPGDAS